MFALTLPSIVTYAVNIIKMILPTLLHMHMHARRTPIYNVLIYNTQVCMNKYIVGISRINKCGKGIMLNRKRSRHDKYVVVDKNDVVIIIFFFLVYGLRFVYVRLWGSDMIVSYFFSRTSCFFFYYFFFTQTTLNNNKSYRWTRDTWRHIVDMSLFI